MSLITVVHSKRYKCSSYFSTDTSLLLLPTFFSMSLEKSGCGWKRLPMSDNCGVIDPYRFELQSLSETTRRIIHNRLCNFLNWLAEFDLKHNEDSLCKQHNLSASFITENYINETLIIDKGVGDIALDQHILALQYYYNYLAVSGLTVFKEFLPHPKLKSIARQNTKKRTAMKYLSKSLRLLIYRATKSLRDEIILRNGGELGLRTKENLGLLLDDFQVGYKTMTGLKTLWLEMKTNKSKQMFEYHLQGKFTKGSRHSGGNSRIIVIPRALLAKYLKYYQQERPPSKTNTLLLNNSLNEVGSSIQRSKGSECFADTRKDIIELQASAEFNTDMQLLEIDHTYHCLRHSFATDKLDEFCAQDGLNAEDISTDHRPFLRLSRILGHSLNAKTSKIYVHSIFDKHNLLTVEE